MKTFKLALVGAMLVGATSVAMAQDPAPTPAPAAQQGQGQSRPNMADQLLVGITLSPAQVAKADSIKKKYADERAALRQDQSMDRDARMAKGREMMTKMTDDLKALLTDDQKKVFEKNLADAQARMQQGGGQRPPQR